MQSATKQRTTREVRTVPISSFEVGVQQEHIDTLGNCGLFVHDGDIISLQLEVTREHICLEARLVIASGEERHASRIPVRVAMLLLERFKETLHTIDTAKIDARKSIANEAAKDAAAAEAAAARGEGTSRGPVGAGASAAGPTAADASGTHAGGTGADLPQPLPGPLADETVAAVPLPSAARVAADADQVVEKVLAAVDSEAANIRKQFDDDALHAMAVIPPPRPGVKTPASKPKPRAQPRAGSASRSRKSAILPPPEADVAGGRIGLATDLMLALDANDLGGIADLLRKARITTMGMLRRHSMSELESALQAPGVGGAKFSLTIPYRRCFASIGVADAGVPPGGGVGGVRRGASQAAVGDVAPAWLEDAAGLLRGSAVGAAIAAEGATASSQTAEGLGRGPTETHANLLQGASAAAGGDTAGVQADASAPAAAGADATAVYTIAWRRAVSECPHVVALFGSTVPSFEQVQRATELVALATRKEAFPTGPPHTLEESVDALDNLLVSARTPAFALAALTEVPKPSVRAVLKWLDAQVRETSSPADTRRAPAVVGGGGGGVAADALLLEAASRRELSAAEQKIPEEIEASRSRFEQVVTNEGARAVLAQLAKPHEGDAAEGLERFAQMLGESAEVAALLYSAHVKNPRGAQLLAYGHDGESVVKHWREARANLHTLVREEGRCMLPDNADARALAETLVSGEMAPKEGRRFNMSELANPKPSKGLLGLEQPTGAKEEKARDSVINMLIVTTPLNHLWSVVHPLDKSVSRTLAVVNSCVSKGLRRHGVEVAVDSILAPLLREYEDEWGKFQRSDKSPMPTLARVWAKVEKLPSVAGYLAQASIPTVAPPANTSRATLTQSDKKDIAKELKKLDSGVGGGRRTPGDRTPSDIDDSELGKYVVELGDKPADAGKNWNHNRKKKLVLAALKPTATDAAKAKVKRRDGKALGSE